MCAEIAACSGRQSKRGPVYIWHAPIDDYAETAVDIVTDFIPGVAQAKTAYDAYQRIQNGEDAADVLMAAGGDAVLGFIPGLKAGKKASKALDKAEDVADKAEDVADAAGDLNRAADKVDTLKPGPFARESIPAHRGRPTAGEQQQVNALMEKHGCHTCGTKNPGTKSGNAIADHQPPQALGEPQIFLPHCNHCKARQGGQVLQERRRRGSE